MKFIALLALLLSVNVFANDNFTCVHKQNRAETQVSITGDKYVVIYTWNGSFPTESVFEGKVTSQFIHDSITLYTLHDFMNEGNDVEFTHYGVVADFADLRMDCTNN